MDFFLYFLKDTDIATEKTHRLNREIKASEVRLIGIKGEAIGVVKLDDALNMAADEGVDLVEVAPNASPPVCKIMDFGKFKYQESKKAHEAKLKQKVVQLKEVKFRPNTGEGDYQIKLRNCYSFLEEGHKVKASLRFRGREMAHQEIGLQVLERVKNDLETVAVPEQLPKMEGRQIIMVLAAKKKKL